METTSIFAALAFVLSAAFYPPYIKHVLAENVHPTISSWISWVAIDVAVLAGMVAKGEWAWQIAVYAVCGIIIIAMFAYQRMPLGWTRLDSVCVSIVAIALGLWFVTGDAVIDIALGLVATIVGSIPFLRNIKRDPTREPFLPWLSITAGGGCGLLAITDWNFASATAPVLFFAFQILTILLISRKLFLKKAVA